MEKNRMTRSLVIGVALQMTISTMAITPHWEATPISDAYYGADIYQDEPNMVVAKDGFVYEASGGSLLRWSKFEGWQQIATLSPYGGETIITMMTKGNSLYFGGVFDGIIPASSGSTITIHNIAKMDLCSLSFSQVGDGSLIGESNAVLAITVDNQNSVYASLNVYPHLGCGGDESPSGQRPIAKCTGTGAWTTLGHGMNFQADPTHYMSYICQRGVGVRALATDGVNIFACGRFLGGINSDSTYVPSAGVIKWDGTHWQTMGNTAVVGGQPVGGIYDFSVPDATFFVNSIAVSGTNVFVTGNFLDVTEPSAAGRNLARFSTSGALLDSPSLRVHYPSGEENQGGGWGFDLTMQPGGTVYLGGIFDQIDGTPGFQSVAKWNGSGWAKLDQINGDLDAPAGYGPIAYSVAADADAMYVHGIFDKAGNVAVQPAVPPASFEIARWVTGSNADLYPKITTVVGDHNRGGTYYGDNGPALSAGLSGPTGISFGPLGELLIADTGNRTIRTVSGGTISGMANGYQYFDAPAGVVKDGNGYFYVAEVDWGGLMKFQSLQNIISIGDLPVLSVAKDGSGNLYCVDEYGNTISQRTPDGNVSVVAGNSTQGYSGDTGPALAAQLFVDTYYVLPSGHGSIFSSTTVDNQGNLYIADTGNNVIRKVDAYGIINTVAGNYDLGAGYNGDNIAAVNAQLSQPAAVAVDAQGNLYIADTGNHRVRRVDQMTGIITTVAGSGTAGYSGDNGAAANAQLNNPAGLVFDASGSLYISDTGNDVIREVTFAPCN